MPDANAQLTELVPNFPLSNALVGLGIFLVLSIEQGILIWHNRKRLQKLKARGAGGKKNGSSNKKISSSSATAIVNPTSSSKKSSSANNNNNSSSLSAIGEGGEGEGEGGGEHFHDHGHGHEKCESLIASSSTPHNNNNNNEDDEGEIDEIGFSMECDHHGLDHDHAHHHDYCSGRHQDIYEDDGVGDDEGDIEMGGGGHDHSHHHHHSHPPPPSHPSHPFPNPDPQHHLHDHNTLSLNDLVEANSFKDLMSAYALEISTAIHSIVIGFDLGVLSDYKTIAILTAVLSFHQFVEGLGLGSVIKGSQKRLGRLKTMSFILVFSCTVSIGVIIGILIRPSSLSSSSSSSSEESNPTGIQSGVEGVVTSLAAGSLLYISLVEMISEYFNLPELEARGNMKSLMIFLFVLGFGAMNIIGIWA